MVLVAGQTRGRKKFDKVFKKNLKVYVYWVYTINYFSLNILLVVFSWYNSKIVLYINSV